MEGKNVKLVAVESGMLVTRGWGGEVRERGDISQGYKVSVKIEK
jgi:hypothetical protein